MASMRVRDHTPAIPPPGGALLLAGAGRSSREVLAGVTLVALSLPMNIGYASVAGLPATVGLYASILPVVVFALLTGSRRLVVGPDSTIAALLAAGLGPVVSTGAEPIAAALAVAAMVGLFLLLGWILRLGRLVRFLSRSVLIGFIAGLGVEVLTSQVRKILAVEIAADGWVQEVVEILKAMPEASVASVVVGLGTIVLLQLLRAHVPRAPGALIALLVVGGAVAWVDPGGVAVLGEVPAGLPRLTFPLVPLEAWLALAPVALAIAALTTAEGVTISQTAARRNGEPLEPNGELFAYGITNVAGALTGAMPIGASMSRTAALDATGARTQVPAVVAALTAAVIALFLTDLIAAIPTAALAGLIASAVVRTIDIDEFRRLARVRRSEFGIAVGCTIAVLVLGALPGLALAAVVSAIDVARRAAAALWVTLEGAPTDAATDRYAAVGGREPLPGLLVLRPGGPLFFANADLARDTLLAVAEDDAVRWVVLDLEAVSDIDPTAAEALADGIQAAVDGGIVVVVSRVRQPIRRLLDRYELLDVLGEEHVFTTNRAAVVAYERIG